MAIEKLEINHKTQK